VPRLERSCKGKVLKVRACNRFGKGGRAGLAKIFVGLSDGADQQKRRSSER